MKKRSPISKVCDLSNNNNLTSIKKSRKCLPSVNNSKSNSVLKDMNKDVRKSSSGYWKVSPVSINTKDALNSNGNGNIVYDQSKNDNLSTPITEKETFEEIKNSSSDCSSTRNKKHVSFYEVDSPEKKPIKYLGNDIVVDNLKTISPMYNGKYYSVYEYSNDANLFVLQKQADITFRGILNVKVIHGMIEVHGFSISTEHEHLPIFSPNYVTPLSLKYKYAQNMEINKFSNLEEFGQPVCLLLLSKLETTALNSIKSCSEFHNLLSFSENDQEFEYYDGKLNAGFYNDNCNRLTLSDEQNNILIRIREDIENDEEQRVVVCGGKNVGKSTFCRYLINYCLNFYYEVSSVIYVETDPGQTETTGPGCVSISIIDKPLLGPPFTHGSIKKLKTFFIGCTTPDNDPNIYLEALYQLKIYLSKLPNTPLTIINTMGWTKGIGKLFIGDTLKIFNPTKIVQIKSSKPFLNLPALTAENLKSFDSFTESIGDVEANLIMIDSITENIKNEKRKLLPKELRSLSLISNIFTESRNIFETKWSDISIKVFGSSANGTILLFALNAQVVGLCSKPKHAKIKNGRHGFKRINEDVVCDCFGLGIIRSIDVKTKSLFIETAVNDEDMKNVNLLLVGYIRTPEELLKRQKYDYVEPFYIDSIPEAIGTNAIRDSRKILLKK